MIAANNDKNNNKVMSAFNVTFSQGGNISVKQENLLSWYIDESFGYMLGEELSPLSTLELIPVLQAVTSKMQDYTQRELLKLDRQQDPVAREADPRTVETSTFVFIPGTLQNLKIT